MTHHKKRILYIVTKSSPFGGAQKAVFELSTHFKNTFDIHVAAGGQGELAHEITKNDVPYVQIDGLGRDMKTAADTSAFFSIYKAIKKIKPDILHLHSPKAGGLGALAGKLLGVKKIIYTIHGWPFNEDRPTWQKIIIKFLCYLNCLLCDQIIFLTQKEKDETKNWPFVSKKKILIENGLKPFAMLPQKEARQELIQLGNLSISPEGQWIGTIAELHKNKSLKTALNAFSEIPFPYIIIGEGEERESLETLIRNKNINAHLTGRIMNAKKYLKAFDVFVLPSIKEGLPYVLLEAGLANVPVIATKVGGIPELIESGRDGILVDAGHRDQLKTALETLLRDPEKARAYAEHFEKKITNSFSLETQMSKTESLYLNN